VPERAGAALRAGLEAERAGAAEAVARFDEVERRWPWIGDHAARLAILARAAAGDAEGALAGAQRFARRYPDSPLRGRVARLRGDAAAALGRSAEAREAWREALAASADPQVRGELALALARAAEAAGEREAARADYLAAWRSAPGSPEAADAASRLDALEAAGLPARSALEWGERGDALLEAGLHAEAVLAYDRALALAPDPELGPALARQRAFALFRARRYPEAARAFEALGSGPEARFWRARAVARGGDPEAAIPAFEALGAESSPRAAEALLLAASLLQDDPARRQRAAAHYAAVAARGADLAQRLDARWRLAWLRYRDGRLAEAAAELSRLAAADPDPIGALRARYFELRARERAAGGEGALDARFAGLGREFPLSYYGWRASLRAPGAAAPPAAQDAPPALPPLGAPALPGPAEARIVALIEAGLGEEADAEIAPLAADAASDADRVRLAELAVAAGSPRRARDLVGEGRAEELARGPVPGREALWHLAWPRAFEGEVEAAAAARGVPPELVYAIMREESGFQPRALSPVGARGLLQLMPETAGRLGEAPPAADALYEPALNVRLGTRLLGDLMATFRGRLSAAAAGYNAGAAPVGRWIAQAPDLADDEWVEAIPYDETRGYVRRVLRSLHAYRVLY
jgi:soluble lytic murein transglycosylase